MTARGAGRFRCAVRRRRLPETRACEQTLSCLMVLGCLLALGAMAAPARAQLPWFDALPLWTPADTLAHRGFSLDVMRLSDSRSGWNADRVVGDARLPFGRQASFFVRLPWVRLDTGSRAVFERWPQLRGAGAGDDWPGEAVLTGFGQLELGATGPLRLPGLGLLGAGVAVGVPLGHSRFYPLSSAGIPARLGLRRWLALAPGWWLAPGATLVRHGGPGDDDLDPAAFPDGWQVGVALERSGGAASARLGWELATRAGRREQWVNVELAVPWTAQGRLGFRVAREVTGSPDRVAAWQLGLSWRLLPRPPASTAPPAKAGGGAPASPVLDAPR